MKYGDCDRIKGEMLGAAHAVLLLQEHIVKELKRESIRDEVTRALDEAFNMQRMEMRRLCNNMDQQGAADTSAVGDVKLAMLIIFLADGYVPAITKL